MRLCPFIGMRHTKNNMVPLPAANLPFPNQTRLRQRVKQGPTGIRVTPRALLPETPQFSRSRIPAYSNNIVTNTAHSSSASSACIAPPSK